MRGMSLTEKEGRVIQELLLKKGITEYDIIPEAPGGKTLPGNTESDPIDSLSGFAVTAFLVYSFWLDWYEDHYTLGDEDGFWEEGNIDDFFGKSGRERELALEIQRKLREKNGTE
jgi:hypothetical protein